MGPRRPEPAGIGRKQRLLLSAEAAAVAVGAGLLLVFLLLLVDFRDLRLSVVAMGQLLAGVVPMSGLMSACGMSLNYANAFVATMILGVGIDSSIHLVHRIRAEGSAAGPGVLETGKAVVLAAATNRAGFGTLGLGSYPAVRSFGLAGSTACLLTALTLVPAAMAVWRGGEGDRR